VKYTVEITQDKIHLLSNCLIDYQRGDTDIKGLYDILFTLLPISWREVTVKDLRGDDISVKTGELILNPNVRDESEDCLYHSIIDLDEEIK